MTIEVLYKDDWYVFAEADREYERECDFGLSMSAENANSTGLTLVYSFSGEPSREQLSPDSEACEDVDREWLYGELSPGVYRISKTVIPDEDYWNACTFRAEFEVE